MIGMVLATSVYFNYALYGIVKDYNKVSTTLTEEVSILSEEVSRLSKYEKGWNTLTTVLDFPVGGADALLNSINKDQGNN